MKWGLCLHGGAVARGALPLHPTDRRAIRAATLSGEVLVIEVVGARGSAPTAAHQALGAGAAKVIRLVDPALEVSDPHATAFVLATAFDKAAVDAILFGDDADPEGIGDVAARVAHDMSAPYLSGVVDARTATDAQGQTVVEVLLTAGAERHRVRLPYNVVFGMSPDRMLVAPVSEPQPSPSSPFTRSASDLPGTGAGIGSTPVPIEVRTLADLKIDGTLVRRRHDGRGAVEIAARPLVTLHSAAAVAALLRR